MARWYRSHADKLNKPKVQRLSDKLYRAWDSLLCVACQFGGVLAPLADTAFLLRKSEKETQSLIDQLIALDFFVKTEHGIEPHQWNEHQYKSDVSTDRVQRHRERQRNVSCNVDETPSDSETESEADTEQKEKDNSAAAKPGADKRGTRLTDGWQLTPELRAFAVDLGLDPDETKAEFVDHWTSVPGSKGLKLDWNKTFKNRCRQLGKKPTFGRGESASDRRAREVQEAIERSKLQ